MNRAGLALALGAALLVLALLSAAARRAPSAAESAPPLPVPALMAVPQAEAAAPAVALADAAPLERAASLRGSDWDGDWALDPVSGALRPSLALRRRFEHLLTQLGERDLPALRAQLRARLAADAVPAPARHEIERLFDAFIAVGRHPYRLALDPRAPHTWQAALAEHQTVRRQHLGWAWAEAFYGEDERLLMATLAQLRGEAAALPAEPEPARHPQAAAREAAAEAAWQDWERRLDAARQQSAQLQQAVALSAPQREAAWAAYLAQHFAPEELPRVRALVPSP